MPGMGETLGSIPTPKKKTQKNVSDLNHFYKSKDVFKR
jgi:hypothetical protein